jgi:hypothetical protein
MKAPDWDPRERVVRERGSEAAGAAPRGRRLQPYSPDLNPIGGAFPRAEALPRFAAARTKDAPRDSVAVATDDCRNAFRSCDYMPRRT